jgi:hypothetical protein
LLPLSFYDNLLSLSQFDAFVQRRRLVMHTIQQAAAEIGALINARPRSPSQGEIADIISRVANETRVDEMHLASAPGPAASSKAEAIELCRQVHKALLAEGDAEPVSTHAHASACREREKACDAFDALRSRLAAKSPKTLDDIAALAVLTWYWERTDNEFLEELAQDRVDRIPIGSRPLPTLLLAVAEFFGIEFSQNGFAI